MKKLFLVTLLLIVLSSVVLADFGNFTKGNKTCCEGSFYGSKLEGHGTCGAGSYGSKLKGHGWIGAKVLGIVYKLLAAFVFSVIFWLTHNWLVKGKKK